MVDGVLGGVIGIALTLNGGGYANFSTEHIILGILSGLIAGTGVLCINIAVSTGVAGPAFAIANLCSVIQALADWGILAQIPVLVEWIGLIISVLGAFFMSIGDEYVLPLFFSEKGEKEETHEDVENLENVKDGKQASAQKLLE